MNFAYLTKYDIAGMVACAVAIGLMLASIGALWIIEERQRTTARTGAEQ